MIVFLYEEPLANVRTVAYREYEGSNRGCPNRQIASDHAVETQIESFGAAGVGKVSGAFAHWTGIESS